MGSNVNFALFYVDHIVDLKSLHDPFISYGRNSYTEASNRMNKEVLLYLRNTYIISDTGFIMESKETKKESLLYGDIV